MPDSAKHNEAYDEALVARTQQVTIARLRGAEYDAMLAAQDRACAICHTTSLPAGVFLTDHNHETGAIRGLLCSQCKVGLGMFDDNPDVLETAVEYLRRQGPTKCVVCNTPLGRGTRYCSRICAREATARRAHIASCQRCGAQFSAPPSSKRRFCGKRCYRLAMMPEADGPRCRRCGFGRDRRALRLLNNGVDYACLNCIATALLLHIGGPLATPSSEQRDRLAAQQKSGGARRTPPL